jgi:hypothetical protein
MIAGSSLETDAVYMIEEELLFRQPVCENRIHRPGNKRKKFSLVNFESAI